MFCRMFHRFQHAFNFKNLCRQAGTISYLFESNLYKASTPLPPFQKNFNKSSKGCYFRLNGSNLETKTFVHQDCNSSRQARSNTEQIQWRACSLFSKNKRLGRCELILISRERPKSASDQGSERAKFFEYAKGHNCRNFYKFYSAKKYPKGYL